MYLLWKQVHTHELQFSPYRRSSDLSSTPTTTRPPSPTSRPTGPATACRPAPPISEEHTSELQSTDHLICRLTLELIKEPYAKIFSLYYYVQYWCPHSPITMTALLW